MEKQQPHLELEWVNWVRIMPNGEVKRGSTEGIPSSLMLNCFIFLWSNPSWGQRVCFLRRKWFGWSVITGRLENTSKGLNPREGHKNMAEFSDNRIVSSVLDWSLEFFGPDQSLVTHCSASKSNDSAASPTSFVGEPFPGISASNWCQHAFQHFPRKAYIPLWVTD